MRLQQNPISSRLIPGGQTFPRQTDHKQETRFCLFPSVPPSFCSHVSLKVSLPCLTYSTQTESEDGARSRLKDSSSSYCDGGQWVPPSVRLHRLSRHMSYSLFVTTQFWISEQLCWTSPVRRRHMEEEQRTVRAYTTRAHAHHALQQTRRTISLCSG